MKHPSNQSLYLSSYLTKFKWFDLHPQTKKLPYKIEIEITRIFFFIFFFIWNFHLHFVLFHFRYLPRAVGMKRIALHKSISAKGDKMYLLVCECSDLLTEISSAAVLIPTIRARLCGYTGKYCGICAILFINKIC